MKRQLAAIAGAALSLVLAGAAPAGASTTWRVQYLPRPAPTFMGILLGVSCPAPGDCTAVGYSDADRTSAEAPLAEQWNGSHWAIEPTPSASTGPPGINRFTAVSCVLASDCTAFGTGHSATVFDTPLVEHWDGASWTVQAIPVPVHSTAAGLNGGTCVSDTNCTATGWNAPSRHGPAVPLIEHWDGTSWKVMHAPLPPGTHRGQMTGGISCPTATSCIATGDYWQPSSRTTGVMAERWNGTRWKAETLPAPPFSVDTELPGISCTRPTQCTAVGSANISGGAPLVERLSGGSWTIQAGAFSGTITLSGVSCQSVNSCTAVGDDASNDGLAAHWDGTSWTKQPTPVIGTSTGFAAVSCPFSSDCTAVGAYVPTFDGPGQILAEHE